MPKPRTPDIEELIRIYQEAQARIIARIIAESKLGHVSTAQFQQKLLAKVNAELGRLQGKTAEWVSENMPIAYREGLLGANLEIESQFKAAGMKPPVFPDEFAVLHRGAVEAFVSGTQGNFNNLIQFTGRRTADNIAEVINDIIPQKIATGQTIREAQGAMVKMLEEKGIQSVTIMRRGKPTTMQLEHYARMVARSATAEATNQAVLNQVQEISGDLVQMTAHSPTCQLCWPLQGRVYSISGNNKNYPKLETAYSGGFANVHPNCRHRIVPYIPQLQSPEKVRADQIFSNRPFTIEQMSPVAQRAFNTQLKVYNAGQKKNRQLYFSREQWKRYQARLGKDAPSTFSGFMRMKKANSENWRKLQADYRSAGREG